MMRNLRAAGSQLGVALIGMTVLGCEDGIPAPQPMVMPTPVLECDVVVVGGGAGGLHTAFRLGPTKAAGVCLFERESALGGRIWDVAATDDPTAARMGTGARRVMEGQDVLLRLGEELGITMETPATEADLINARGVFGASKDDLRAAAYASVPASPDPELDTESWLYDQLRFGPERARTTSYADFRSYIRSVVGAEGYEFLRDMSRFRADFEYPLDARGYLDYLDEEWDVCCTPSYPVGGMSTFIKEMETRATQAGVRIFLGEPVTDIVKAGAKYELTTSKQKVRANELVIAIPPVALEKITGDVSERIQAQKQFQELVGVRVVTITQWWPTAWWSDIKTSSVAADTHVWRAWTTEHCLNFIEIPLEPYAVAQKVTRTVYDDDIRCVTFWEELAKSGTGAVEAEIKRGLEHLFSDNGVTTPERVTIPEPIKTHVQVWPAAWHWLRAGATHTNADIFEWAVEPLAGEPVALVGEAYNPQRSGWSDAAYKSSIKLLNTRYGMNLTGLQRNTLRASLRRSRAQAGH